MCGAGPAGPRVLVGAQLPAPLQLPVAARTRAVRVQKVRHQPAPGGRHRALVRVSAEWDGGSVRDGGGGGL